MKPFCLSVVMGVVLLTGYRATPGGESQDFAAATLTPFRVSDSPSSGRLKPSFTQAAQHTPQGTSSVPDLIQCATRTRLTLPSNAEDTEAHLWLSDRQMLFLRPTPKKPQFRAVLADAETGTKSLPEPFNSLVSPYMPIFETGTVTYVDSSLVRHIYEPPVHSLSLNGKWLLWRSWLSPAVNEIHSTWRTARLDGSQTRVWKRDAGADHALWLRDGSGWIEFSRGTEEYSPPYRRAILHSLADPDHPQTIRWKGVDDCIFIGITAQQKVLVYYVNRSSRLHRQVRMAEVGFQEKVERPHHFTIQFPKPTFMLQAVLSPDGKQIAWMTTDAKGFYQFDSQIWLSDIHGKGMHLLGHSDAVNAYIAHLQWLPDGARLSFVHDSSIWTIPIKELPSRTRSRKFKV